MTGRSKSIRCPEHGIYYNPDQADGCVKCIDGPREPVYYEEPETRPRGSSFSVVSLLVWLLVLSGVGYGGYRFFSSMGERGGEIYAEVEKTASRIDPALVRPQIEAVEALVYAQQVSQFGHGTRIQRAAMVLYSAVMRAVSPLLGTRHGQKIVGFGSAVSQYEDAGYTTIDMTRVRRDWEELREEVFWEADWLR